MSTQLRSSLQSQLSFLASEQITQALTDVKRVRPSFLYDSSQSALIDRRTLFSLASIALGTLVDKNSRFADFTSDLFSDASVETERYLLSTQENKIIDSRIEEFLTLLSPYFLFRPAQKCLEWLVQRFHIHTQNSRIFILCALPYYDHIVFVRVVQICDLKKLEDFKPTNCQLRA
ncbi:hypothetical protein ACOME3_008355 [Neoechinorhynchus agilis]